MPATDQYLRNIKKVHVVFCLSAIAFALSTVLILYRDHDDEWRGYQSDFDAIETAVAQSAITAAEIEAGGSVDAYTAKSLELKDKISSIDSQLVTSNTKYAELSDTVAETARIYDLKGRDVRFKRADRDVAKANLDLGIRDAVPTDEMEQLTKAFNDARSVVDILEL